MRAPFLIFTAVTLKIDSEMIKPLTSLRFVFALMVFAAHCYVIDPYFSHFLYKEGFVGVGFFFVLSGFIIAYNYQRKFERGQVSRHGFWIARFARIYPLHIVTLFLLLLAGGYLPAMNRDTVPKIVSLLFLLHPFIPDIDYFFSFNSPSWSLGCEQLFYFLFPFLALRLSSTRRLFWLLIVAGGLAAWGMFFTPEEQIRAYWYVNPFTRLPDFLVGMLLYKLYEKRTVNWSGNQATWFEIGAVAVFMLFYYAGSAGLLPKVYRYSVYYWVPISLVIYVFAVNRGALSRFLSNKYLVIGGDISYAIYLSHLVFIELYKKTGWNYPWQAVIPVLLAATIGFSLLSFYYFEKPVNRYIRSHYSK